jgi:hypothetical protein|tara:strand:+ start:6044 stop:6343 length:300 start_codon:yes stop_codon:yes gene_type:complete
MTLLQVNGWGNILDLMVGNLGISFPDLILLMVILSSIVFFAMDLRIGLIVLFMLSGGFFVVFTLLTLEAFKFLVITLMAFVFMMLSLLISHRRGTGGVI